MKVSPCKDCAERHPCCHDSCGKYGTWKSERDAIRDWNRKTTLMGYVYSRDLLKTYTQI